MSRLTHITTDLLREHGACEDQVALFEATFGQRAKIGPRNWARAVKAGLDVDWLACLLPPAARAEYDRVKDAAWAEYDRVRDAALLSALMETTS